jgi:hypothetical protein
LAQSAVKECFTALCAKGQGILPSSLPSVHSGKYKKSANLKECFTALCAKGQEKFTFLLPDNLNYSSPVKLTKFYKLPCFQ